MPDSSTKTLWSSPFHSAFTDLCMFQDELYCCFREALTHVSNDGKIVILRCDHTGNVKARVLLQIEGNDLRDPKLTIMPDGKLLLIAYARVHDENGSWQYSRPICWFSGDGRSWSAHHWFGDNNWWLWRLRWHNGQGYGLAYNRAKQSLSLYKGNPLRHFEILKSDVLSLANHQLGYPNESDICFTHEQRAYAIVRRDADTGSAQLGVAKFPFKQWRWHDLKVYIGSPVMHLIDEKTALIAGRIWQKRQPKTALIKINLQNFSLTLLRIFESAGDNSYPGMVLQNQDLILSYYSSHIDNICQIYLTTIPLADIIEQV